MIQLRDYQARDVERIRRSYATGHRAPLYVLPTGGGKTVCFAHIAQAAHNKGSRVIILTHRSRLLRQASRQLAELGIPHGRIAPKARNTRDIIQVASIQTLSNRLDRIKPPDLIIGDEGHHLTPKSQMGRIVKAFPGARLLIVTATPERLDRQGLGVQSGGFADDMILGPTTSELMDMGYLCRADVYAPALIDTSKLHRQMGDFNKKELADMVDTRQITGNAVEHYAKICPGVPAVAFCVSVLHAKHVTDEFRAAGFRWETLEGSQDEDEQERILQDLESGAIDGVSSCELISEGMDIPRVGCVILLRPTESPTLAVQQPGRGLRPYAGKDKAIILDHSGNIMRHIMVPGIAALCGIHDFEPNPWTLEGSRRKKNEAPTISVRQCSECYFVYKAFLSECPQCGHRSRISKPREVEQIDGELVKLDKERAEFLAKKRAQDEVRACKTLEELQELGRRRGYKPNWAHKRFEILEVYKMKRGSTG